MAVLNATFVHPTNNSTIEIEFDSSLTVSNVINGLCNALFIPKGNKYKIQTHFTKSGKDEFENYVKNLPLEIVEDEDFGVCHYPLAKEFCYKDDFSDIEDGALIQIIHVDSFDK